MGVKEVVGSSVLCSFNRIMLTGPFDLSGSWLHNSTRNEFDFVGQALKVNGKWSDVSVLSVPLLCQRACLATQVVIVAYTVRSWCNGCLLFSFGRNVSHPLAL